MSRTLDKVSKQLGRGGGIAAHHMSRVGLFAVAKEYGVDQETVMGVWVRIAEENKNMPSEEIDRRAIATIMRGRKSLELTTGEPTPGEDE
ncbi:hypothetical protein DP939_02640 [Spongiactinospora rosea]|uniref:Uncharacterized protein n=1 Tax=Spongiactinospora rosea TaxID=2248750 RepID=A0A366M6F0_9ACTN|nr:hypothetical protein [Spongiactinospora rosea]RBQ21627.1 hypothetical protein DP939_02640 [Spongiactinospora rosea]